MKNEGKQKMSKGQIACWIFGVLFVLSGVANLASGSFGGLLILLGGAALLPPVKSILQEKTKLKSSLIIVIAVVLVLVGSMISGSGTSSDTEEDTSAEASIVVEEEESHIYDNAEIVDVMNGTNTEKVGEMSLIKAESSEVTLDALTDWYFNYVEENDYNYCLILYTDVEEKGCYSVSGYVLEGAMLEANDYGLYMLADSSEAITYYPTEDGTLEAQEFEEEAETDAEEEAEEETADDGATPTTGEANALSRAKSYLAYSSFSYSGLIDQLEYEGYTTDEATYAADNCGADWNEQALEKAKDYLDYTAFSYTGLIDQLEYEGFTTEQATYGADNCEADWMEQAAEKAKDYLEYSSFSRSGLIDQLEYEGFTTEQAEYAADSVGY